jgi:hypothetical protein
MAMTEVQPTLAQRVRLFVFQRFAAAAAPPVVEELMTEFGLTRTQTVDALRELWETRHIALVKGTARILMAFPFSAIATPFRVKSDGKNYFANCAWDAIAFHAMLDTDIAIESYCQHCARPISIDMSHGAATRVEPESTIVYLALRPIQWWDDIITTCSNTMVFFCSPEHRDASDQYDSANPGASLTPDQVHQLGEPLYATKLAIDYSRPGREELAAHFASLGLTGPYWQI